MNTVDWDSLKPLIESGDQVAVAKALRDLDDKARRALAGPLRSHVRELNKRPQDYLHWDRWRTTRGRQVAALRVAGLGCLTGAEEAAKWLAKSDLWEGDLRTDGVPVVLQGRRADWVADVVTRFAGRIRPTDWQLRELAVELVRDAGVAPPATEGFVMAYFSSGPPSDAVSKLRADPLLTGVVSVMFDVDGIGPLLEPEDGTVVWASWLSALADEGVLNRADLVDGCLRRMLRGGKANALRGYVAFFTALAPTPAELSRHVPDLLQLLPDSPSNVAAMAQRALQSIELSSADFVEAGRAVFSRTEKNIVTAQLSWLDKQDRAADVVMALTELFADRPVDLQRRAVTITLRSLDACPDEVRESVRAAAAALPSDLRDKVAAAVGTVEAEPVFDAPAPVQAMRHEIPPPIASPEELAEELAALAEPMYQGGSYNTDPMALERVLAGLVTFAADRVALRNALEPLRSRYRFEHQLPKKKDVYPLDGLRAAVSASISDITPDKPDMGVGNVEGELAWRGRARNSPPPYRVLLYRMHEIAARLAHAPIPALVSVPTLTTGHLDPDVLLARLETAADEGWEPAEYDLQQAFLRLPRNTFPALAERATKIGTPAGDRLAARLLTPLPDPVVTRVDLSVSRLVNPRTGERDEVRMIRPVMGAEPEVPEGKYAEQRRTLPKTLADLLWQLPPPRDNTTSRAPYWASSWSTIAPGHRDVIAAHLAQFVAEGYPVEVGAGLLSAMETDGPLGPGTDLAVAFALGSPDRALRATAVDILLTLHAENWDATTMGTELGTLAAIDAVSLARAVPILTEAASAGAAPTVWSAIAAALPAVLASTPKRTPDLLVLATDLADRLHIHTPIPAVATAAASPKSTRVRTEARRLNATLDPVP